MSRKIIKNLLLVVITGIVLVSGYLVLVYLQPGSIIFHELKGIVIKGKIIHRYKLRFKILEAYTGKPIDEVLVYTEEDNGECIEDFMDRCRLWYGGKTTSDFRGIANLKINQYELPDGNNEKIEGVKVRMIKMGYLPVDIYVEMSTKSNTEITVKMISYQTLYSLGWFSLNNDGSLGVAQKRFLKQVQQLLNTKENLIPNLNLTSGQLKIGDKCPFNPKDNSLKIKDIRLRIIGANPIGQVLLGLAVFCKGDVDYYDDVDYVVVDPQRPQKIIPLKRFSPTFFDKYQNNPLTRFSENGTELFTPNFLK
jgi:hypothetical protein